MSIDLINEFGETLTVTRYSATTQDLVLQFDADFVAGNSIDLDVNLSPIATVPFNGTHAQTLADLATAIAAHSDIAAATVTGAREITMTAASSGVDLLVNGIVVLGGASQPSGVVASQAGGYVDGEYQDGGTTQFDIVMSVQPLQGEELELLQKGERTRRYNKGYTVTRLFTASDSTSAKADRIAYDGTIFEVHSVERWVDGDLHHYKVMLAEVNA